MTPDDSVQKKAKTPHMLFRSVLWCHTAKIPEAVTMNKRSLMLVKTIKH